MITYSLNKTFKCVLAAVLLLQPASTFAQHPLDGYIREGLKNNLVLQQKNLTLQQAQQSLQIAKSYFLPSVNLIGDYTSGEGGRSIALPVGDLLNPVYASLNQMTGSDAFPQIENVNQNFFPKNFYDVRVRTSMPLINNDVYSNRTIQSQQVMMKQHEADIYKRQLVMEIKTAYYNYLASTKAVKIYESAQILVNKNVEINESLVRNGKGLPANYLRAKSEAEKVKADLNSARNSQSNARKYFNFLLNKPLDSNIDEASIENENIVADTTDVNLKQREELQMLQTALAINQSVIKMNKLNRLPKVNAFMDLGSQAYDWQYNDQSRYYLVGVQLSLPLFQGFRNNTVIRQNKIEQEKTEFLLRNTESQLQMAVEIAGNEVTSAHQNYSASVEQLKYAQNYFNLVDKGYQQGVNSLIEYLDARNQLTTSQLQQSLRWFDTLIANAKLERETATYSFE